MTSGSSRIVWVAEARTALTRTAEKTGGERYSPYSSRARTQRASGRLTEPGGRPGRHCAGTLSSTMPPLLRPLVSSRVRVAGAMLPPSSTAQLTSGAGPAAGAPPPVATGGGGAPGMSAGTRASDTDGAGLATPAGAASPIHSMLPGPGAGPNAVNPASAGSTAEVIPFTVTATAASVAGVAITVRSVSNMTWPLPAWKPAGTGTDAPAAGATVKVSSASAAVAGSGVTPAMRKYSTRAFSGSLFTRLSSGSIWMPNSRTRATPESSGAGLVQSAVKPAILA